MAERIIAKLRRKVPKFALMVARDESTRPRSSSDVVSETFEVLRGLGHSESDARRLLDAALSAQEEVQGRAEPAPGDLSAESEVIRRNRDDRAIGDLTMAAMSQRQHAADFEPTRATTRAPGGARARRASSADARSRRGTASARPAAAEQAVTAEAGSRAGAAQKYFRCQNCGAEVADRSGPAELHLPVLRFDLRGRVHARARRGRQAAGVRHRVCRHAATEPGEVPRSGSTATPGSAPAI